MREERVRLMIETLSLGDSNMRTVLDIVYGYGKEQIDRWPDSPHNEEVLGRRMVRAVGRLTRHRIDIGDLCEHGVGYWRTEAGEVTQRKLAEYIRIREERGRD